MSVEVLRFLVSYGQIHGEMPSLRMIAEGLHTYTLNVFKVVRELEALGYVRRSARGGNARRILGVTDKGREFLRTEGVIYG